MPNQHATNPKAVRLPGGLEARVKAAVKDGETVNAFIVAAIEEKLQRREGGSTALAVRAKGGSTTRKPRPAPVTFKPAPEGTPASCPHRIPPGAYCKTCGTTKPEEGKR